MNNRAQDWLKQAEEDLEWAKATFEDDRFPQCCFICQQVAEKALKALSLQRGYVFPRSHSVLLIAQSLNVNGEINEAGRYLDKFYITSRYPDAFPDGIPSNFITQEDANEAVRHAEIILNKVRDLFK